MDNSSSRPAVPSPQRPRRDGDPAPAASPPPRGWLHTQVRAVLAADPDTAFTVAAVVARLDGPGHGAVANALAHLADRGDAHSVAGTPLRYRHARPGPPAGHPTSPGLPAPEPGGATPVPPPDRPHPDPHIPEARMTAPPIRQWLTPAAFAAAVPQLAGHPLPAISHTLADLATTAVAVLAPPDTALYAADAVYLVAPSHALLVDVTGDAHEPGGRHVHLPAPLAGSAAVVPVPVVTTDDLLAALAEPGCAHPSATAHRPEGWAHRAVADLAAAAGTARRALHADAEQDLRYLLPALADALDDLADVTHVLTPYCGDHAPAGEARLATVTALLLDGAALLRRAHVDVVARLDTDQRSPDLRLTQITVSPHPAADGHAGGWHAVGLLTDARTTTDACHATVATSHPHPTLVAAIDAVRDSARACNASRPNPDAEPTLLRLSAPAPHPAEWDAEIAAQATRLRMRLPAPEPGPTISDLADRILAAIDDDITEGALPASVRSFTDLHRYLDANDYLQSAGVPGGVTDAAIAVVGAVQDEVTRRLSAPGRRYCTHGACAYPGHDHTTTIGPDGADLDHPIPMCCNGCGQPAHHDAKLVDYRHDDPAAPDCFLIHRR